MNFLGRKLPLYSKFGAVIISSYFFLKKENQIEDVTLLKSSFQSNLRPSTVRMDYGDINPKNIFDFPLFHAFKADCAPALSFDNNTEAKFLLSPLNRGLLANIDDKTGLSWSKQLKIKDASKFLRDADEYLVSALKDDGRNMREIKMKADRYLQSSKVCGRKELLHQLKGTFEDEGKFICLLGGKSFGKSKCLHTLAKEANQGQGIAFFPTANDQKKEKKNDLPSNKDKEMLVLLVNMRSEGDKSIVDGLLKTLSKIDDQNVQNITKKVIIETMGLMKDNGNVGFLLASVDDRVSSQVFHAYCHRLSIGDRIKLCESLIQELSKTRKVSLIIDEANLVFDRSHLNEEQFKQAQADLALFTLLTKQERKLNVILSTSDYSFPFKLKSMKFNIDDWQRLLYFNEVSPRDCYELLVNEWDLGENLAISLLNVYGGHLLQLSNAIDALALSNGNDFITPLSPFATGNILTVIEDNHGYIDKTSKKELDWDSEVVKALKSLAETGFYPIANPKVVSKGSDLLSMEEQLSQLGIAGVVERHSIVPGIPKEMWKNTNCGYALVPSSQTMRLKIAQQLK